MNTPTPSLRRFALVLPLVLGIAGMHMNDAHATSKKKRSTTHHTKSKTLKIQPSQNHSGESPAERDRRLYRECQGLPNAGACRGYTRR